MSKILITFLQPIIGDNLDNLICYYEGLIKELQKNNNDLLVINVINLLKGSSNERTQKVNLTIDKIEKFNPDLIITFNNQIDEEFIKVTNCPIALVDADAIDLFVNLELVKKYNDRYFMITNYDGWYHRYQSIGFKQNRICTIHPATAIKRENLEKTKNISFIGSNFNCENNKLTEYIKNDTDKKIYNTLKHFWTNHNFDYTSHLKEFCKDSDFTLFDIHSLFDSRIFVLNSVLDLGLNLYGLGWERLYNRDYALTSAFDRTPKFSLKHNQEIYNSSKINLSISHPQTNGYAFPWRIYDIMASNGMLISTRADLLSQFTKGYVNIPMYDSPYDARDLCKYALNNPNYCEDIVEASNKFIEKFGRWDDNFEILENLIGVSICNQNTDVKKGNIEIIKYKITSEDKINLKNIIRLKIYKQLKETLSKKHLI